MHELLRVLRHNRLWVGYGGRAWTKSALVYVGLLDFKIPLNFGWLLSKHKHLLPLHTLLCILLDRSSSNSSVIELFGRKLLSLLLGAHVHIWLGSDGCRLAVSV
jgi:hypothetical protein